MEKIKGRYEDVKAKILDEYNASDVSICEFFSSIICEDLSIEETVKLCAELRSICDGDLMVNAIDSTCIIDLANDKELTENEFLEMVRKM